MKESLNNAVQDEIRSARRMCACGCHGGMPAIGLPFCCPCQDRNQNQLPIDLERKPLQIFPQAILDDIKDDIKRLFRWINDLSELRHETNQNEGCTRAKVENDIIPALERQNEVNNSFSIRIEHAHERIANAQERMDDLQQRLQIHLQREYRY